MYTVCYQVTPISADYPDDLLIELNQANVNGLALINQVILRHYRVSNLYAFAPRYHINPKRKERWKDIGQVLKDGWGDCKDFTAWRLAELWSEGTGASAESIVTRHGRSLMFHTYVRYADGRVEDPAKKLGMP